MDAPATALGIVETIKANGGHCAGTSYDQVVRINPSWLRRIHTALIVPLLKEGELVRTVHAFREEVRPFTGRRIALLQNFGARAVIAMENSRLITETREPLEQQTATRGIAGHQFITLRPPVFDAILEKSHILCGAAKGSLVTIDAAYSRSVAIRGLSEQYAAILRQAPHNPPPGSGPDRMLKRESVVHLAHARDLGPLPSSKASAQFYMYRSEKSICTAPKK